MKALLIDDERIARQELRRLLAAHPEVETAGEARHVEEAAAVIAAVQPDVLSSTSPCRAAAALI